MDTNKVSNLFGYLKNKHGEECVRFLKNWEFTIKKIKMGITPVSCKIKKTLKSSTSYKITHKAEKQLLYEWVRNINNLSYMYEHNRYKHYSQLKSMNTDNEVNSCIQLINKTKEHRQGKIKARQMYKFKHLVLKSNSGYRDKFTRHNHNASFHNSSQNSPLSSHSQNLHYNHSSTSTSSSTNTTEPTGTVPMAPVPTASAPTAGVNNTIINTKQKWVINLTNTPLLQDKKHF